MSAEITPERIAEIRAMPHDNWRIVHELLDALESSRAEVQRLTEEVAQVKGTEERYRRVVALSDGARLDALWQELVAERDAFKAEARRSDAGRVVVPEIEGWRLRLGSTLESSEALMDYIDRPPSRNCSCHISPPCSDCVDNSHLRNAIEDIDDTRKWYNERRDRLSPSPQPATGPFGCCSRCGGVMELSDGWVPSYGDPDNSGGDPMAWPHCPKCDASPQPSADVVVVPREEWRELRAFARISGYPEGRFSYEVPFEKDFAEWGTDIAHRLGITRDEEQSWLDALRSSTNHDAQDAGEGR